MFPIRDSRTSGTFPFVNLLLIAVNLYVFFLELTAPNMELFAGAYALIPANVDFLKIETLTPFVTSMFLHAGFLHILSNMWFLWIFGDNVEGAMGHVKYLIFYIFCGFLASFMQYLFITGAQIPMVGASGAIAGVLGAYLKYFPRNKIDTLVPIFGLPTVIAVRAGFMLIYWFLIQAFSGYASIITVYASGGGIAYIAHASGFLTGYIFSGFLRIRRSLW